MGKTIAICGLGLIGGSLAKAVKASGDHYIIGYDPNIETINYALEHKIIDQSFNDFETVAKLADIIILAAPISATIQLIEQLDQMTLEKDVIVTDVASVKGSILKAAQKLTNKHIFFIGGHPMSGSHKSGIWAAKEILFENAIYILTPTTKCSSEKVEILKDVLKGTKSKFVTLEPAEHDEMTSVVSHFPHLIASSLVHQAKKWEKTHAFLPELAAGGFRDITRIASSNPKMWQDIFYHNGNKLDQLLDEWIEEMSSLKEMLKLDNKEKMINYLDQAKAYRDGLPTKKGALPRFYDLYVDIKDQPGAIASVVDLLATNGISITNIRILEIRDHFYGALRLTFSSEVEQLKSHQLLKEEGYEVMIEE